AQDRPDDDQEDSTTDTHRDDHPLWRAPCGALDRPSSCHPATGASRVSVTRRTEHCDNVSPSTSLGERTLVLSAVEAAPRQLRLERDDDATCLGVANPMISWLRPAGAGAQQAVQVRWTDAGAGGEPRTWRMVTEESVFLPWPGEPLRSGQRGSLQVRSEHDGGVSPWSEPLRVHVAPLVPADWTAQFITPAVGGGLDDPAPVLTGQVQVEPGLVHARLLLSAL